MSHIVVLSDRVKELSYTTGTGPMALNGAATGFSSFGSYYDHNAPLFYAITDGTNYEVGSGLYQSAAYDAGDGITENQLVRFPMRSSNSHSKVDWSDGTKEIYVTYPATHSVYTGSGLGTFPAPQASGLAFWETSNLLNYDNNIVWDSTNKRVGIGTGTPQYSMDIGGHGASSAVQASGFIVGTSGIFFPSGTSIPGYSGGRQIEHFIRNELDQSALDAGLIGGSTGSSAVLELSGIVNQYIFLKQQSKGLVLAGPASGCEGSCSPAYPSFRFLTLEDIPSLASLYVTPHDTAAKGGVAIWHEDKIIGYDPSFIWDSGFNKLGVNVPLPTYTLDVGGEGRVRGALQVDTGLNVGENTVMSGNLQVRGNLDVVGTTTYIDSETVTVLDKNLELGSLSGDARWTDAQIDGGGLILKTTDSTGDKLWIWKDATDAWTTSGNIDVSGITGLTAGSGLSLTYNSNGQLLNLNVTDVFRINSNDSTEREVTQDDKIVFKGVSGIATSTDISASNPNTLNVFFDPTELSGILNSAASTAADDLTTANFTAATLVTEPEGLNSSDNDTSIPTTAAVKDYADLVSGLLPLAGSGLILTTDNRLHFADPNSLTSMLDGDIVSNDQLLIFDDDPGVWKSVTIEELQDEIQAGNIVAAGSGLIIDGDKKVHLSDPANLTSMLDGDIIASDQLLIFDNDPGVWKSVTIEELQDEIQDGNVITAGSGLILDSEKQMHLSDPANLTSMADEDIVSSDQLLVFDDDPGVWKSVTIEELQDEMQGGNIITAGSGLVLDGEKQMHLDDPANLTSMLDGDIVASDQMLIFDDDSGKWKTVTIEELQDEIDPGDGGGGWFKYVDIDDADSGSWGTSNIEAETDATLKLVAGSGIELGSRDSTENAIRIYNTGMPYVSGMLVHASGALDSRITTVTDANTLLINASGAAISGWANNRYDTNATTFHASGHAISGWAGSLVDGIVSYHASGHAISGWANNRYDTNRALINASGAAISGWANNRYDTNATTFHASGHAISGWAGTQFRTAGSGLALHGVSMVLQDPDTDYDAVTAGTTVGADQVLVWDDSDSRWKHMSLTEMNAEMLDSAHIDDEEVDVSTDYVLFLDGGVNGAIKKESWADFAAKIAGTNIGSSNGQLTGGAGGAGGETNQNAWSYVKINGGADTTNGPTIDASEKTDTVDFSGVKGVEITSVTSSDSVVFSAAPASGWTNYLVAHSGAAISGWAGDQVAANTALINASGAAISGWAGDEITANTALINASGAAISGWASDRIDVNTGLINDNTSLVNNLDFFKIVKVTDTDGGGWGTSDINADTADETLSIVGGSGIELGTIDGTDNKLRIYNTGMPYVSGMLVHASGSLRDAITANTALVNASGASISGWAGDQITANTALINASGASVSGYAASFGIFKTVEVDNTDTEYTWDDTTSVADAVTDTLKLVSGSGIELSADAELDSIRIYNTGMPFVSGMLVHASGALNDKIDGTSNITADSGVIRVGNEIRLEPNTLVHLDGFDVGLADQDFKFLSIGTDDEKCWGANNGSQNIYRMLIGYKAGRWDKGSDGVQTGNSHANMIGAFAGYDSDGCNDTNALGRSAGSDARMLPYSNIIGYYAGFHATGCSTSNMIGREAGRQATGCDYTTMIGLQAGMHSKDSESGIMIGNGAGFKALMTLDTIMLGRSAASGVNSCVSSVAIGYQAGAEAVSCKHDSMIGSQAGYEATNGLSNNIMGYQAGYQGSWNQYTNMIGATAGYGSYNNEYADLMGYGVGRESTRLDFTSAIGYHAMYRAEDVESTVAIGYYAGAHSKDALKSVFHGRHAGYGTSGVINAIAIGPSAMYKSDHRIMAKDENGTATEFDSDNRVNSYAISLGQQSFQKSQRVVNSIAIGRRTLEMSRPFITNWADDDHIIKDMYGNVLDYTNFAAFGTKNDVAIGYQAMSQSRFTESNIAIGEHSMSNVGQVNMRGGSSRTYLGRESWQTEPTAQEYKSAGAKHNIAIGTWAGYIGGDFSDRVGVYKNQYNTFIGYRAGEAGNWKPHQNCGIILAGSDGDNVIESAGVNKFNLFNTISGDHAHTGASACSVRIGDVTVVSTPGATLHIKPKLTTQFPLKVDTTSTEGRPLIITVNKHNINLNKGGAHFNGSSYIQRIDGLSSNNTSAQSVYARPENPIVNSRGWLCVPCFDARNQSGSKKGAILPKASENNGMVAFLWADNNNMFHVYAMGNYWWRSIDPFHKNHGFGNWHN